MNARPYTQVKPRPGSPKAGPLNGVKLIWSGRQHGWSGRRDSNPRPSPWQGGGFRPSGSSQSSDLRLGPASFHPVHQIRPCCRALYYELSEPIGTSHYFHLPRRDSIVSRGGAVTDLVDARAFCPMSPKPNIAQSILGKLAAAISGLDRRRPNIRGPSVLACHANPLSSRSVQTWLGNGGRCSECVTGVVSPAPRIG